MVLRFGRSAYKWRQGAKACAKKWPICRLVATSILLHGLNLRLKAQTTYTPYDFATLAGVYGSEDGPGPAVHLNYVIAVAVDQGGTVYFADDPNRIRKLTPGGIVTSLAGTLGVQGTADGAGPVAQFYGLTTLAMGADGDLYATDGSSIRKISPSGVVHTLAGTANVNGSTDGTGAAATFNEPLGVAADQLGNAYVADTGNSTIRKIGPDGLVTTLAGTAGAIGNADGAGEAARFRYPRGLVVDGSGNMFVADSGNSTVRKIAPNGLVSTFAGTAGVPGSADGTGSAAQFAFPVALAIDQAGNLFVADWEMDGVDNFDIRKIAPDGTVSTPSYYPGFQGQVAPGDPTIAIIPWGGLATDSVGNLYIGGGPDQVVWRVSPAGVPTAIVGTAGGTFGATGSADGVGANARFNDPDSVAVDTNGNVYVADRSNAVVRKILPGGEVTTLAGTAGKLGSADGVGSAAQFSPMQGIAVDKSGNVYVADSENETIRKITPGGEVSTLAGTTGIAGSADGAGSTAQFNHPLGIAVDGSGNLYVADTGNNTIRKITTAGMVTTLAGAPGPPGYADGTGVTAQFNNPTGVAVDAGGNVYVGETSYTTQEGSASYTIFTNSTIRKITPNGAVTTLAGSPYEITYGPGGNLGTVSTSADGTGTAARFNNPVGLAVDGSGNVYVADEGNDTIRRVTPTGVVTTLAGEVGVTAGANGTGATVLFSNPTGVAVDSSGNLYVADSGNNLIRVGALNKEPSGLCEPAFAAGANSQTVAGNTTVVFSVSANTKAAPSYQWFFDGDAIVGATQPTLIVNNVAATSEGYYDCVATNSLGVATSSATLTVIDTTDPGRLINLSCRSRVGAGADVLIAGFVVGGNGTSGSETLLLRASGPALTPFGVTGFLPDPDLQITNSTTSGVIATNDGWGGKASVSNTAAAVGAFPWSDPSSHDSALLETLPAGPYTALIAGASGDAGIALAELYDATPAGAHSIATPRLINISARTQVGQGANVLIAGFVVGGTTSMTVLIRASGPALVPFGISDVLPDPQLQLNNSIGLIATNAGWGGSSNIAAAAAAVGAFSWGAGATLDSALLITLSPGAYTAEVSGASGDTGIALVEIYEVE